MVENVDSIFAIDIVLVQVGNDRIMACMAYGSSRYGSSHCSQQQIKISGSSLSSGGLLCSQICGGIRSTPASSQFSRGAVALMAYAIVSS